MATAGQIRNEAMKILKNDGVLISAADLDDGKLGKLQVYFWDEGGAVMDVIDKDDLVENWPDEVRVINPLAKDERTCLPPVRLLEVDGEFYLRVPPADAPCDDLGSLPRVAYLEAIEQICALHD